MRPPETLSWMLFTNFSLFTFFNRFKYGSMLNFCIMKIEIDRKNIYKNTFDNKKTASHEINSICDWFFRNLLVEGHARYYSVFILVFMFLVFVKYLLQNMDHWYLKGVKNTFIKHGQQSVVSFDVCRCVKVHKRC